MAVDALNHYNLRAPLPLLDVLRDFYIAVVGLELGFRPPFSNFGYWLYAGGRPILHLTEALPGELRPIGGPGTFDHAAFACTDDSLFRSRLERHGIKYRCDTVPLSGELQLFFKDPAGNGVELTFPPVAPP
jgi:catechol 2,3-dioxygenase-like lactoylglutathione lyase family enzyme